MAVEDEPTNGNRATVAMVYRAVDDLSKITEANFKTVSVKLEAVANLSTRMDKMESEHRALGLQVLAVHSDFAQHVKDSQARIAASTERSDAADERNRYWRRNLPNLILIAIATIPGWVALFT